LIEISIYLLISKYCST